MAKQPTIAPVVRIAPLGELRIYPITEAELDELERGSPSSLHLNFATFFWGSAVSLFGSLFATTDLPNRTFLVLLVLLCAAAIAGLVFTVLWVANHRTSGGVAKRIRERMPPPPAIQEITALPPGPQSARDLGATAAAQSERTDPP